MKGKSKNGEDGTFETWGRKGVGRPFAEEGSGDVKFLSEGGG
jgi:hypothetical protein